MPFLNVNKFKQNLDLTNYLIAPQNVAYYLLLSPYKLKTTLTSTILFERNITQQLACGIFTTLGFVYSLYSVYLEYFRGEGLHNMFRLFQFVRTIAEILRRIIIIKILWLDQKHIVALLNFLRNVPKTLTNTSILLANSNVAKVLASIHYAIFIVPMLNKNLKTIQVTTSCIINKNISCVLTNGIKVLSDLYAEVILSTSDMFLFVFLMLLWSLSRAFTNFLAKQREISKVTREKLLARFWNEIENQLCALKKTSDLVNSLVGHLMSCFMIGPTLHHAVAIEELLAGDPKYKNGTFIVIFLLYFTLTWIVFAISAEIPRNIGHLKEWLFENGKGVPKLEACLLWNQLESNFFACIRACNVFPITYGFIGSVSTFKSSTVKIIKLTL